MQVRGKSFLNLILGKVYKYCLSYLKKYFDAGLKNIAKNATKLSLVNAAIPQVRLSGK